MDSATVHTGESALDVLREEGWDELLAAAPSPDPTRRAGWLEAWHRHRNPEARAAVVAVRRDGELVAALPLILSNGGGLRRARHLGADGPWMSLEPPSRDAEARRRLFAALVEVPADLVILDGLEAEGAVAARDVLPGAHGVSAGPGFRLHVDSPPRSMRKRRKEVRRGLRRAEDAGRPLSTRAFSGAAEVVPRLDAIMDFHARHFDRDPPNGFAGPEAREFTRRALGGVCADDLRLVEVRDHEDRLVAFDLAIVSGEYASSYSGALDRESGLPNLGWISVLALIESLAEEGVKVVDFGPESAGYKSLIADPVPFERLYAPLTAKGRAALAARRAKTWLRGRIGGADSKE
jgi:CelD/BcsL family acetyltransferase involved in cellulose biosynthesis